MLGAIDARLAAKGEERTRADLYQLKGLCERMDSEAFLPVTSDEFAPSIPRRIDQYCVLIDDVVGELEREGIADTKKLKATGARKGYRRYMRIRGNGCHLGLLWDLWATGRETPLWLRVYGPDWSHDIAEVRRSLAPLSRETPPRLIVSPEGKVFVPLFLPLGKERQDVLSALVDQIRVVGAMLPDHSLKSATTPASDAD